MAGGSAQKNVNSVQFSVRWTSRKLSQLLRRRNLQPCADFVVKVRCPRRRILIPCRHHMERRGFAMMGRQKNDQEQLFYSFCLDEVVPDDHLVRGIAAVLDLSWVHAELAPYYPKIGRPSIDPVLMIRLLVVGYVFAIRS